MLLLGWVGMFLGWVVVVILLRWVVMMILLRWVVMMILLRWVVVFGWVVVVVGSSGGNHGQDEKKRHQHRHHQATLRHRRSRLSQTINTCEKVSADVLFIELVQKCNGQARLFIAMSNQPLLGACVLNFLP